MGKKKLLIFGVAAVVAIAAVVAGILIAVNSGKEEPKKSAEVPAVDEKSFKINNLKFLLDTEKEFEGIKYVISKDFREIKYDLYSHYVQYDYLQKDETNLLYFRIFHYTDKDAAAAAKDLGIENPTFSEGKTDNIEYKFYNEPRDDGTIHFYFITKDTETYALHFASRYDIRDFESKILKTVKF